MKNNTKSHFLLWLIVILALALGGGAFLAVFTLTDDLPTQGLNWTDYSVGDLDDEGEFVQSDTSICTKEMYPINGLVVDLKDVDTLADEADITYKIYYFDADKEFLGAGLELDQDTRRSDNDDGAEYFKIVITPTDEDAKVTVFNINSYLKQISVTFEK
jgi:hypothetical protein